MLTLALAALAGGALGAFFFGGLWWTVRKSVSSPHAALWLFGSLLLRMPVTLLGFYFVSGRRWQRLLACLLGFAAARLVTTWWTRQPGGGRVRRAWEAGHAP
jgi:F1F0 ATPase subunit 2